MDGRLVRSGMGPRGRKTFTPIEIRPYHEKSDLKLFKRQSYHVAIAYHIHLRSLGPNPANPRAIDPTFKARRLR